MATTKKSGKTTAKKSAAVAAVSLEDVMAAIETLSKKFDDVIAAAEVEEEDVEDVEEDEDDEDGEEVELTQEVIDAAVAEGIKSLRALAAEVLGDDAPKTKADILEALGELVDDEDDEDEDEDEDEADEDDEDDEEDEEDDDDDEEGYDRDELEELSLKDLRKIAKEEGASASDVKGLDQDALIDLIMGEDDEDDEEEDEDDEDEDDEEVEEIDEDTLNSMTHKELVALCKDLEIKVPKPLAKNTKSNAKKIVALILESGDE